jgi:predicted RNA-binding protein with PIN domain
MYPLLASEGSRKRAVRQVILVDGYNLIYATPALNELRQRDLALARERLLQRLITRYRHTPHELIVVFDGDGPAETSLAMPTFPRGSVVYSQRGEKADPVIVRLATASSDAGFEVWVYSNDGEVRWGAERAGATPARADHLRHEIQAAPHRLHKRFIHQQHVRREWEKDMDDAAEARAAIRQKGNPRKPPRRR